MGTIVPFPGQPLVATQETECGEWRVVILKPGATDPEVQVTFASRMEALLNAREGSELMGWRFVGRYLGEHRHVHA